MAAQTKGKLEKSGDIKKSSSLPVETPVETPIATSQQPKQYMNFIFLGLLLAALLVTAFAVRKSTQQKYKAAVEPIIAHVQLDPGVIITKTDASPIQVSTLAYDENYNPIWSGVGYNWGMSTAGSVGTLSLNPGNDKIAVFKPLNKGVGDIFVTATNVNGNGFGSIQVFVDVTPTPTQTPGPTPTTFPTIWNTPTPSIIPTLYVTPTYIPTLTPTIVPKPEFIFNGSFETGTDVPDGWTRGNQAGQRDFRTDALSYSDIFSFKFYGEPAKAKSLQQSVNQTWRSGTQLYLGGWLKTIGLTKKGIARLAVRADYTDKTQEFFPLDFPTGSSYDWTYRLGSIRLSKTTKSLLVRIVYSKQDGQGFFDAVSLTTAPPLRAQAAILRPQKVTAKDAE